MSSSSSSSPPPLPSSSVSRVRRFLSLDASFIGSLDPFTTFVREVPSSTVVRIHFFGSVLFIIIVAIYLALSIDQWRNAAPFVSLNTEFLTPKDGIPLIRLAVNGVPFQYNPSNTADPAITTSCPITPQMFYQATNLSNSLTGVSLHNITIFGDELNNSIPLPSLFLDVFGTFDSFGRSNFGFLIFPPSCSGDVAYANSLAAYVLTIGTVPNAIQSIGSLVIRQTVVPGGSVVFLFNNSEGIIPQGPQPPLTAPPESAFFFKTNQIILTPNISQQIVITLTKTIDDTVSPTMIQYDALIGVPQILPTISGEQFFRGAIVPKSVVLLSMNPAVTVQTLTKAPLLTVLGSVAGGSSAILLGCKVVVICLVALWEKYSVKGKQQAQTHMNVAIDDGTNKDQNNNVNVQENVSEQQSQPQGSHQILQRSLSDGSLPSPSESPFPTESSRDVELSPTMKPMQANPVFGKTAPSSTSFYLNE